MYMGILACLTRLALLSPQSSCRLHVNHTTAVDLSQFFSKQKCQLTTIVDKIQEKSLRRPPKNISINLPNAIR
ncbi:hypothetical protein F4777DRAFT_294162 [Nemania sp. FL0916]|nr:hypothetical protein F4777DRAFT_294162 [Nemania sp. FL0916]